MRTSIKVVVGLLIASVLFDIIIIPLFFTVLYMTTNAHNLNLENSPILNVINLYSSIAFAGIYVGISKGKYKLLLAVIISFLYYPVRHLIIMPIMHIHFDFNLVNWIMSFLKYGFVCVMFSWLSNTIFLKLKKDDENDGGSSGDTTHN